MTRVSASVSAKARDFALRELERPNAEGPAEQGLPGWARRVSNLRPLACEASALPLSYAPWGLQNGLFRRDNLATGLPCAAPLRPLGQADHPPSREQKRLAGRQSWAAV